MSRRLGREAFSQLLGALPRAAKMSGHWKLHSETNANSGQDCLHDAKNNQSFANFVSRHRESFRSRIMCDTLNLFNTKDFQYEEAASVYFSCPKSGKCSDTFQAFSNLQSHLLAPVNFSEAWTIFTTPRNNQWWGPVYKSFLKDIFVNCAFQWQSQSAACRDEQNNPAIQERQTWSSLHQQKRRIAEVLHHLCICHLRRDCCCAVDSAQQVSASATTFISIPLLQNFRFHSAHS